MKSHRERFLIDELACLTNLTKVDIEHDGVGALDENSLLLGKSFVDQLDAVASQGTEAFSKLTVSSHFGIHIVLEISITQLAGSHSFAEALLEISEVVEQVVNTNS